MPTRVLPSLQIEPELDLTAMVVNDDTEKDLKKRFNVHARSTFVVLRGQRKWGA